MIENLGIVERIGLIAMVVGLFFMVINPAVGIVLFAGALLAMARPWRRREKQGRSSGDGHIGDGPDIMDSGSDGGD